MQFARMITNAMQAVDIGEGHALAASAFRRFETYQAEFMQLNDAFDEFSLGSEELDVEGLAGAMNRLGLSVTDEDVTFVLNQLDSDQSGKVDVGNLDRSSTTPWTARLRHRLRAGCCLAQFAEFATGFVRTMKSNDSQNTLREAFYKFDMDGNGTISPEELKLVLSKMGVNEQDMDAIIEERRLTWVCRGTMRMRGTGSGLSSLCECV